MKTMSVGEFKAHFSEVLENIKDGEPVAVTYGKKKKIVAYLQPAIEEKKPKRKLGILEGKASFVFGPDFEMTEEEFLGE